MRHFIISKKLILTGVLLFIFSLACTDLTEEIPDQLTSLESEEEFIAALGEAYTILGGWQNHGGLFALHEISSDEALIPQRGPDWFDGGVWIDAHRHRVDAEHGPTNGAWTYLFSGVNATSRLILQFENLIEEGLVDQTRADQFISELRVLRGFYNFWLLDTFGNVPIIDNFADVGQNPPNNSDFQTGRTELFNFIESEVVNSINIVTDDVSGAYGRIHQDAAHFLLAKLYLNAEVYTGTARWADAEAHLDAIIDGGNFTLNDNFFDNFSTNNQGSSEAIFAIPYDEVFLPGFNMHHMTLHYSHQETFNFEQQPWNGYATLAEFYNSFDEDDERREGFIVGLQFDSDGDPLLDPDQGAGHHLNIDPEIPSIIMTGDLATPSREKGARFNKFQYEMGAAPNLNNDFPVFRYADVILMKAEVQFRQNGGGQMYLDMITNRAGAPTITINEENLLAERGRELYTEIWRRQDLIRFGQYNEPWWEKDASEPFRNVFPIPRDQRDANANLNQNPGY
ncbi:RagB/SusD family nutrient uptake outer membrane protein [soil metagenome]